MPADMLISVIDDDESARDAVVGVVRALGFVPVAFPSAVAFLQSDAVRQSACLITDMRMADMTGLELHQSLVAAGTSLPTILVTAYPDETVRLQALSNGITCYLTKPLDADHLLTCIRSAVSDRLDRGTGPVV